MPWMNLYPRGVAQDGTDPNPDTRAYADLTIGYDSERKVRTIVHDVPGADEAAAVGQGDAHVVTLRHAGPRAGTLQYIFSSGEEARRAELIHTLPGEIAVYDEDWFGGWFFYVAQDAVKVERTDSRRAWILTTGFSQTGTGD